MKMDGTILLSVLCKIVLAVFAAVPFISSGEQISFSRAVPVFEKADVFSKCLRILPPGTYETAAAPKRAFSNRHPIAYYSDFAPLKEGGFVSPGVTVDKDGVPFFLPAESQWQTPVTAVLIAVLAVSVFLFARGKKKGSIEPDSFSESAAFILIAVLIRQILILSETSFWSNALPSAADEPGYFKVISDILQGSFSGPWNFTMGLGLLYLPFVLLTGAKEYYDIALSFSYFNALVIAPAAMGLFYLILKNFKVKSSCAFAAILIWAVYPFFVYHTELWGQEIFKPLLALPCFLDTAPDWFRFYSVCINAGFNAMSDVPGLTALMGTILLALKLPMSPGKIFLVGAAYGFCCLIRINYIFLAPLLAFICLEKTDLKELKTLFKLLLAGAGGFLAVFGWQLAINTLQFGNPLTFGYSLHYLDFPAHKRPDTGFNWSTLLELKNIRFLAGANKLLMTAGIAGLLFLKSRRIRIALSLMAIPLILFFFGYTHTYCDARRFIMMAFPAFMAAFCCGTADVFSSLKERKGKFMLCAFLLFFPLLWFMPAEIYAVCLCLLLLSSVFDLQQEVFRGILLK